MTETPYRIAQLIYGYLQDNLTATEHIELQQWLDASPSNSQLFDEMTDVRTMSSELKVRSDFSTESAWASMKDRLEGKPKVRRITLFSRPFRIAAAAAVFFLFLGGMLWRQLSLKNDSPQPSSMPVSVIKPGSDRATLTLEDGTTMLLDSTENGDLSTLAGARVIKEDGLLTYAGVGGVPLTAYNRINTPNGGQYRLVMSDGTKVWLNAASSIRFPVAFGTGDREVEVTGEAYFEVAKAQGRPFRVRVADQGSVEVLGTMFNVNAYPDEQSFKTTLLEGSVRVSSSRGTTIRLEPGQQAILRDGLQVIQDVDTEEVVAWKEGWFQFNRADVATIMRQVSRWYDVDVVFEGEPGRKTFSGMVSRNNDISQVLMIMERAGVRFRIEGRKIYVW